MAADVIPMQRSQRGGLAERAYQHIKELLVSGRMSDYEAWLPVEEIAKSLDMSRQPVMDALRRLSAEGFVEIVPQVGCRARAPSLTEVRDMFLLYAQAEALVSGLAAERASDSDILSIQLVSAQIGVLAKQRSATANKVDMYWNLNRNLHSEIRRSINSPSLAETVENLSDRCDFFYCFADRSTLSFDFKLAHAEHEQIVKAIARRDAERASEAMRAHIAATEQQLERNFPGYSRN